jgi:NAD(P)-dependent dehydrogenase (short-subunit alcohol dehydrogenase family)
MESQLQKVDMLMCVAGLMMPDGLQKTKEGVEMQFAVNYLGHFVLTANLFSLLRKSEDPRIVTFSSIADRPDRFDLDDATAAKHYSGSISYALSKLCCLMFAVELAKRSEENGWGVSAFGVHPGLAKTQLFNRSHGFTMSMLQIIFFIFPFIRQSATHAALPALFAATSPKAVSGKYYGPWFLGVMGPHRRALMPLRAKNRALRKELWDLSVSLSGKDIS